MNSINSISACFDTHKQSCHTPHSPQFIEANIIIYHQISLISLNLILAFCFLAETARAGLEVDHEKAFELHLKAANMGMARAQFNTAVHYFEGSGVEQVKCD